MWYVTATKDGEVKQGQYDTEAEAKVMVQYMVDTFNIDSYVIDHTVTYIEGATNDGQEI